MGLGIEAIERTLFGGKRRREARVISQQPSRSYGAAADCKPFAVAGDTCTGHWGADAALLCLLSEEILKILEKYCGARLTTHAFRIGGLQYEVYDTFEKDVERFCKDFESRIVEYERC